MQYDIFGPMTTPISKVLPDLLSYLYAKVKDSGDILPEDAGPVEKFIKTANEYLLNHQPLTCGMSSIGPSIILPEGDECSLVTDERAVGGMANTDSYRFTGYQP